MQMLLLTLACLAPTPLTQDSDTRVWEGTLKIPELPGGVATVRIETRSIAIGRVKATFRVVADKAPTFDVDLFEVRGRSVSIAVNKIKADFSGTLNEAGDEIDGTWNQDGQEFPLTLKRMNGPPPEPVLLAVWAAKLGEQALSVQFRVIRQPDGSTRAFFDSLDQNVKDIPAKYTLTENNVEFLMESVGASFSGTLNEAADTIEGKWKQNGGEVAVTFRLNKNYRPPRPPRRPQTPTGPFRYEIEDVSIENPEAGVTLAGTLTLPRGAGPFPVAVLISGSGAQDRDETLFSHKPFLVIADDLTKAGIGVLRYDDRGFGESTGDFGAATSVDFASDVRAAVAFLRKHASVDPDRVGLIGHSEGGLIAPMVAAKDKRVAFIVMMAGPAVTGLEIIRDQSRRIAEAEGVPAEVAGQANLMREAVLKAVIAAPPEADGDQVVTKALQDLVKSLPEEGRFELSARQIAPFKRMATPWFRYFLTYDPAPTLEKVGCPVLAINGEKDLQVWHGMNLPVIVKSLKAGGNDRFRAVRLPHLNHLFQRAETGAVSEYNKIEQTIAPETLSLIRDWVREVTRK